MGAARWLVATPVVLAGALLLLTAAGVVFAAETVQPEKVCVPAKAGKPVVSANSGTCKVGYTLSETGKEGPQGPPGEGAVGYSEYQVSPTPILPAAEFLDKKTLPAGHYLVTATVPITAQGEKQGSIGLECVLVDQGTSTNYIDRARSFGPLTAIPETPHYLYETTLALTGPLDTTSSSTVGLECHRFDDTAEAELVNAARMQLTAVQTTANH